MTRVRTTALAAALVIGAALVTVLYLVPMLKPPGPRPGFQLPVSCDETWHLGTYPGHDDYDIDFFPTKGKAWGRPVLASFGGTVVEAGINGSLGDRTPENPKGEPGSGGGYWVKIDHGGRWETLYLHMLEPPLVQEGDTVRIGQQLGRIGSTGDSGAPHLHYEQVRAGRKVESVFDGVPSGITSDNKEYSAERRSNNCGP